MMMQGKTNVLDDQLGASWIVEGNVTKFKSAPNRPRGGDGIRLRADTRLERQEVKKIFQEHRLFGDVIEPGEDSFDISARAIEGPGQESEAADRDGAGESAGQDDRVGSV